MFSLPTAYLIVGLMYLVMSGVAWVVLSGLHSRAAQLWCGGSALFGVGVVLLGLRQHLAEWATYPLANGLMILANLMRIQALHHALCQPRWSRRWLVWLGLAFVAGYEYLRLGLESPTLRAFWSSSILTASFLYISLLCWRIGQREASRSAYWVAAIYLVVGGTLGLRSVAVGTGISAPNTLFGGWDSLPSVGATLISSVVGSMGFIGIFLERARRKDLAAVAERVKQEENIRLGAQIAQLDRQRCLGQMSASLGHELNQPLAAIFLNAEMAQHGLVHQRLDAVQLQELLHDIEIQTQRAGQIIERIRSFIRPVPEQHKPVELCQLVHDVAQLLAYEARNAEVVFTFALPVTPVWVHGDDVQLSQIVLNVYRNAVQAMRDAPPPRQITVTLAQPEGWVLLHICDTGPGLAPDALVQVCQPFFTTKADGLGLGLSISQAIAQRHGGTLQISNRPQSGVQVELALPAQN